MARADRHAEAARPTLASRISVSLREAIMRGDLAPGSRLHVDDLREQFDVSLSPVREALSRLGSAGLVDIEDQRGYRVAPVSPENLAEVIRLRMEMESLALAESVARPSPEWQARVREAMEALSACPRNTSRHGADETWERLHRRFHLTLLSGRPMPLLLAFVTNLHDLSDRYRRLFLQSNPPDRDVPDEHRRIFEAVMAGESDLACALLRQHIRRTGSNVQAMLTARGEGRSR